MTTPENKPRSMQAGAGKQAAFHERVDIPAAWQALPLDELHGVLMVIGAPDTGKSTFANYLAGQLYTRGRRTAFLDGDPGQSSLGPPTTLSLALPDEVATWFSPQAERRDTVLAYSSRLADAGLRRHFVGSVTPQGHMLQLLVGAARLVETARQHGAEALVYDTSGLVDPGQGGVALKSAKIDLLQPQAIIAIQRQGELDALLLPLRRSRRVRIFELQPSPAVAPRTAHFRRDFRSRQFRRHFSAGHALIVDWGKLAVFPAPFFRLQRLAAFEDAGGFCQGLGIVTALDRPARQATILTPLVSLQGINALRLGDLLVNPQTFEDQRIP
jgi:polynucleotide 5'-hydroxyl-kinase GRC3/NOL9